MTSRSSHHAANTPASARAPTERLKYAPATPHWSPRLTASDQTIIVERRLATRACRGVEAEGREEAAGERGDDRERLDEPGHDHQREEAGGDEVLDGVDTQRVERVELLADLARAEVGGDRGAGHARNDDRGDVRGELPDRRENEEPAEAVDRAEQDEEVAGLQSGGAVVDGDHRQNQREPAEPEREQELVYELTAVGIRWAQRGHGRLPGEDHHVPHLLEQVLDRKERPVCCCPNHSVLPAGGAASRRLRPP